MSYDKLPGEWYGPTTAAYVLRDLATVRLIFALLGPLPKNSTQLTGPLIPHPSDPIHTVIQVHRQYLGGGVRVLVTQAEVIYIDEINRLCCPEQQPTSNATDGAAAAASSSAAGAAALMAEVAASGGSKAEPFFDPLLHRPPEVVEADSKAQARREQGMLNRPWIAGEGVVILVPLRLGLASLNGDYIPGACVRACVRGDGLARMLVLLGWHSPRHVIIPATPHIHIPGLLATLQIPHSLGFVGGKPNHAIYFVGNRYETR